MPRGRKKKELPPLQGNLQETHMVQKSKPLFSLWKSELTLSEFKILDTYLSRIDSHKPEQREVVFEKGELEELLNVKKINKTNLEMRLVHLQKTTVNIGNRKTVDNITLFERAQAQQDEFGKWKVRLTCTPSAMKYIFNVEKLGYLRYQIRCITNIKSLYSYIMFTYLEYNRFRKSWEVPLEELKDVLNCTDEYYNEFYRFNQKILQRCQNELHEKTDIRYTYEPIRKGRSVAAIRFTLETLADQITEQPDHNVLPGQLSLEDCVPKMTPYDELIDMLSDICNGEFGREDVIVLHETMLALPFNHYFEDNLDRANFLRRQYNKVNAMQKRMESKGEKMGSRLAYLQGIIKNTKSVTD